MKFRLTYNLYSGILFALIMEYLQPIYMTLKHFFGSDQFSFFLFLFTIGWFTPLISGVYYFIQIEMNKLFSKWFVEEEEC